MISFLVALGPFGSPYYLGVKRSIFVVVLSMLTITYSVIEQPEAVSKNHLIVDPVFYSCILFGFIALALELFSQITLRFSAAFEKKPWIPEYHYRIYAEQGTRGENCPPSTVICPFTNKNGKFQCPECHARVHDDAWHSKEEVAFVKAARNIINHQVFSATVEQTPDDVDNDVYIERALQRLQDARVLMGNNAFITSTPCCLGCYYQHRYHTLLPRLFYSNLVTSFISILIPYTVAVSFDNPIFVDSMRFWAAFCGILCIIIQLDIIGSTCHFIAAYDKSYIDEVDRIQKIPRWLHVLCRAFKREKFDLTLEDQKTSGSKSFGTESPLRDEPKTEKIKKEKSKGKQRQQRSESIVLQPAKSFSAD